MDLDGKGPKTSECLKGDILFSFFLKGNLLADEMVDIGGKVVTIVIIKN